ncbi:MAG TPA: twin-arginine translocase subunit TatC, partial [Lacipirellulaceae bacterium]|nr:twin-arginine translocase subunit TatC [Lacipirellulaceae bacterium]
WQFVAAGLYPHEQWYIRIFLPFSIVLFLAGAALAFFVVFKFVLAFLLSFYDWMGIDPDARISDWLSFVLILPLGFGISFQLPLVMLFLERINVFSISVYLSNWRMSVLVISFLAAILAPADPYSMLLMVAPLVGLYFFGVMLCKWMPRRTSPFGTELV